MPTARIDIDQGVLNCVERNGQLVSMVRGVRVIRLENTDYSAMQTALTAAGVPAPGHRLEGTGAALVLIERRVKVLEKGTADIELIYELASNNQDLQNPLDGVIRGKTRSSIRQTATNFFRPNGTGPIQQIVVGHRFPADDPDYPGQYIEQGGEVTVFAAESTFTFGGYLDAINPWRIETDLTSAVNSAVWRGRGPHEWMCVEVDWHWIGGSRYWFDFEFQHNPDTWNPTAVFVDARTNRPPPGLLNEQQAAQAGQRHPGYIYVPYQKTVNFSVYFGSYFEGVQALH